MKRKVHLAIDELRVDSFDTATGAPGTGTVHANDSGFTYGTDPTCEGRPTCNAHDTCNYDSCDGVCGSYYCFPGDSGLNLSCVYSCQLGCGPGK